jgi:threonyl-tRNA synthetase
MLEEAKKRDHRKLGKELEIYVIDDDVGPGLPLWLPRGAAVIEELEKLAKETEFAAGYQRVRTPHINVIRPARIFAPRLTRSTVSDR